MAPFHKRDASVGGPGLESYIHTYTIEIQQAQYLFAIHLPCPVPALHAPSDVGLSLLGRLCLSALFTPLGRALVREPFRHGSKPMIRSRFGMGVFVPCKVSLLRLTFASFTAMASK